MRSRSVSVACRSLTKRFDGPAVVDDISFEVPAGAVTGFVGANGAGKSTTMRMVLGLVTPTSGDALVNGRLYRDLDQPRRTVGAVLDGPGAHPGHTARTHLAVLATAAEIPRSRVAEVLDLVGLTEHARRRAGSFSTGMRQRLGLAAALLGDPEILVLDEPASGLDPPGLVWMRHLLRQLADEGRAVLVSSHLLSELAETADRVVIIDRGRLVADTTLRELLNDGRPVVELRCADPSAAAEALRARRHGRARDPQGRRRRETRRGRTGGRGDLRPRRRRNRGDRGRRPGVLAQRAHDPLRGCLLRACRHAHHPVGCRARPGGTPTRRRGRRRMTALLRAEARRVLATPTIWWLLLGTVAVGIAGTVAPLAVGEAEAERLLTDRSLQEAMHGAAAGVILVVVAGILGMAGDWRFGQAGQTFLTTPRRHRIVAARVATYMGVGAVFGTVAAAASGATAWVWYRTKDVALPWERSAVWLTLLGCVAVAVLFGVLGVALGALTRNQVVAIVGAMGWLVVVEPILFAASSTTFRWLPGMASFSLRRQPTDGLLSVGPAAVVLIGVVTAALAVGTWLVERDDVTA